MRHANVALFVTHYGCPHMCSFCDQNAITGVTARLTRENVDSAVCTALDSGKTDPKSSEIAFFGGSFTAIDTDYMKSLLEWAYVYVSRGLFKGIRISTRPDYIDNNILDILKSYGVTAVELGAQSMDDTVLFLNERGHTADDVRHAAGLISAQGFELGLQMMTGLYGSSEEKDIFTANELISLCPATVRIYPTVVLKGTRLCELFLEKKYNPPGVDETVDLCAKLLKMFNDENISVIRLGLHSGGDVEENFVAGAYHPALRELVESKIYLNKFENYFKENPGVAFAVINVAKGEASKATGHGGVNKRTLEALGMKIKIHERESLSPGEFFIDTIR